MPNIPNNHGYKAYAQPQHPGGGAYSGQPPYGVPARQPSQMPPQQKPPKKEKKRSASFYVAVAIAALAVIVACVLAFTVFTQPQTGKRDPNGLIGQVEGKSTEEIQAELDRLIAEGMLQISIASKVEFKDGTSEGAIQIENVPNNHYLVQVTIVRNDTGEQIYESGILEPNYHIQTAKLDTPLPKGTYECTATFHALDMETEEERGTAAATIEIDVLN